MKKIFTYKRTCLLGLIPISLLLIVAAKQSSYFAEQIFAKHIYRWLSKIISSISGIVPFSIAEILVLIFPVIILIILVRLSIDLVKNKSDRGDRLLKGALNLLCTGSIILFLFTILGGLNYYRYPFSTYSNLEIRQSSLEELYKLTESLAYKANELRDKITVTDEKGVFKLSMSHSELADLTNNAYELLAKEYPVLEGEYAGAKPILLSEIMSKTEITGIFMPFTMEANVNVDIPDYTIPATMLHELAHLRGFMREDEANFLAYIAGMESDNSEVQYSSTMLALVIAGNALYNQDKERYLKIRDIYSEGVIFDLRAHTEYWLKHDDTTISKISNKINDTYLKANAQTDGVKSYGRMLDLLLAKYRKDHTY